MRSPWISTIVSRVTEVEAGCAEVLRRRHLAQTQAARKGKEGKKRMKRVGRVEIPQEAFLAVLKVGDADND
jgi:GTP-binding protein LepA